MSAVLVVDDTPSCLHPLASMLRLEGHAVRTALHGKEALEVLERFTPDCIILDLTMPVMDGMQFLEAMRGDGRWKGVRVMVFTAYGQGLNARRLAELGVGEIFLKASIDFTRLLKLVA